MVEVKIFNERSGSALPTYATPQSAGVDLRAWVKEPGGSITLKPLERKLIHTGIFIQLPSGFEAQVRPRSGLALKHGISILNSPGTIDEDYIGEICVILVNISNEIYTVEDNERIAQLVIGKYEQASWNQVNSLDDFDKTERADGGFGHTGTK